MTAPARRWASRIVLRLLVLGALLAAGCLGTLTQNAGAQTIALAPRDRLPIPVHENRPHWLLRSMPGWEGAHKVRFGGDPSDPTAVIVRAALFQDETTAQAAFARLTPTQLYSFWHSRMAAEPTPVDAPTLRPGGEARVFLYLLKSPSEDGDAVQGQFTVLRRGRAVLVVESIGVPPTELIPVLDALIQATATVAGP